MAMALTYDPTFSSVHIALTGITPDGSVRIEKSANNGPPWETVRGGIALPILIGEGELDDYEFFADVENFYRVLRVDPIPGLVLTGALGGYASTPDDPTLDVIGDIDLRADLALVNWEPNAVTYILSKYYVTGDQRSYSLRLSSNNLLSLVWSPDGTNPSGISREANEELPIGADGRLAVRATLDVDNGSGGHSVSFYTAPTIEGPWTQLGTSVTAVGTTSIFAGTAPLEVSGRDGGTAGLVGAGTVLAVEVRDGINGTEVANPDFAAQPTGTATFDDDAGRTWTINGTATISGEFIEDGSITPSLNGETWLKSIKHPNLNRMIPSPDYRPIQRASRAGLYNIKGRSTPIAVYDVYSSRWYTIETVTYTLADARDMDLILAAGGTWFLHVPLENDQECFTDPVSGLPGGYVEIQSATMSHDARGRPEMQWVLPLRVVTPPGPEITGTLLTWGTVERLYGSWTALWASNPTWRDLWNQIGSPDDLVVL